MSDRKIPTGWNIIAKSKYGMTDYWSKQIFFKLPSHLQTTIRNASIFEASSLSTESEIVKAVSKLIKNLVLESSIRETTRQLYNDILDTLDSQLGNPMVSILGRRAFIPDNLDEKQTRDLKNAISKIEEKLTKKQKKNTPGKLILILALSMSDNLTKEFADFLNFDAIKNDAPFEALLDSVFNLDTDADFEEARTVLVRYRNTLESSRAEVKIKQEEKAEAKRKQDEEVRQEEGRRLEKFAEAKKEEDEELEDVPKKESKAIDGKETKVRIQGDTVHVNGDDVKVEGLSLSEIKQLQGSVNDVVSVVDGVDTPNSMIMALGLAAIGGLTGSRRSSLKVRGFNRRAVQAIIASLGVIGYSVKTITKQLFEGVRSGDDDDDVSIAINDDQLDELEFEDLDLKDLKEFEDMIGDIPIDDIEANWIELVQERVANQGLNTRGIPGRAEVGDFNEMRNQVLRNVRENSGWISNVRARLINIRRFATMERSAQMAFIMSVATLGLAGVMEILQQVPPAQAPAGGAPPASGAPPPLAIAPPPQNVIDSSGDFDSSVRAPSLDSITTTKRPLFDINPPPAKPLLQIAPPGEITNPTNAPIGGAPVLNTRQVVIPGITQDPSAPDHPHTKRPHYEYLRPKTEDYALDGYINDKQLTVKWEEFQYNNTTADPSKLLNHNFDVLEKLQEGLTVIRKEGGRMEGTSVFDRIDLSAIPMSDIEVMLRLKSAEILNVPEVYHLDGINAKHSFDDLHALKNQNKYNFRYK